MTLKALFYEPDLIEATERKGCAGQVSIEDPDALGLRLRPLEPRPECRFVFTDVEKELIPVTRQFSKLRSPVYRNFQFDAALLPRLCDFCA